MSGRAALLATSPEQAHAAAHATAMAAMAAGFSPHASLAAAYGLAEGTTPYGSHPMLQVGANACKAHCSKTWVFQEQGVETCDEVSVQGF